MIAASLAGKRIAVTGATGFVGTALVERLLRGVPECTLVLLVRNGKRTTAAERVRKELLKNDAFDRLRAAAAAPGSTESFDAMCERRIVTVAGDVSRDGLGLSDGDRAVLADCDLVIHSAAAVSFDSPLDSAVEINLLGPMRIAETLNALGVAPHLVAVSTCYVAGNRRGNAPEELVSEGPFDLGLDWQGEVAAARRLRADSEAASRDAGRLKAFRAEARGELGAAGAPALAAKTEQLRQRWVRDRLVEAGRARAASVGWPDAYAFTKALGEQALTDRKGAVPVSIVRPSIIESAWAEPRPGWIRGFRMAEPVIISYARGLLREFPGVPEGTVDVIPVDLVVAAIIAVAAIGPERAPAITQVASGSVNPLKYRTLVDNVSAWFTAHPLYDAAGQPIVVPEWRFPGRGRVQGQLSRAKTAIARGEQVLRALPLRGRQADLSAKLESKRQEVERALEYVELYGLYTECEAIYQVDRLLGMLDELDDADREAFDFDPRHVDWVHYINEVHLPSIVRHARVKTVPGKTSTDRSGRLRRQVLVAAAPPGRVRSREHADREQRGGELLVARHPPSRRAGAGPVRRADAGRGAPPAAPGPHRPHRLPALLLPPLRARAGRADRDRRRGDARSGDPHQELPGRAATRPRAPRPRASHRADHRGARTSPSPACARCSTRSSPPRCRCAPTGRCPAR